MTRFADGLCRDILVIGSPIWLGQPSSVSKQVLERIDAFLGERDEMQRMPSYGKAGLAAVVGNEDGAHHVAPRCVRPWPKSASPFQPAASRMGRRSDR
jgi:multimeric flavodoxin WrbA